MGMVKNAVYTFLFQYISGVLLCDLHYQAALIAAFRPSVTCFRFSRNRRAVETYILVET